MGEAVAGGETGDLTGLEAECHTTTEEIATPEAALRKAAGAVSEMTENEETGTPRLT